MIKLQAFNSVINFPKESCEIYKYCPFQSGSNSKNDEETESES